MTTAARPGETYKELMDRIRTDDQEEGGHIHLYLHGLNGNIDLQPSATTNPPVGTSFGEIFMPNTRTTANAEERQVGSLKPSPVGFHYEIRDLAIFLVPDNGNEEEDASFCRPKLK